MYLENKIVLLGIAMSWNDAKGIKIFEALANSLSDEYKIMKKLFNIFKVEKLDVLKKYISN